MPILLVLISLLWASQAQAGEKLSKPQQCLSCHINEQGILDIVGVKALQALPEDWQIRYEDALDRDGDGIAGKIQFVSGGGKPLIAKWGSNLAAATFADFALIAGKAHGIAIESTVEMDAIRSAFERRSLDPELPFLDDTEKTKFEENGCARCHVTDTFALDGKAYMPLSDFLLHDLGDGMPKRTKPLWGCRNCLWNDPHKPSGS